MTERVLVVGAASPLGRAVGVDLASMGHEVRHTSRVGGPGYEPLDVTDRSQTLRMLETVRPTAVVYLARPNLAVEGDVFGAIETAVDALRQFAIQSDELGVSRILLASSASVYGTEAMTPRREIDPTSEGSPNATLKLRSEKALSEVSASGAITSLVLRIFNIYGPGLSASLVNRLALGEGSPPLVQSTDQFVRDYVHVADVARAFSAGVAAPVLRTTIVNIGTGIGTSNRALLGLCPNAIYRDDRSAAGSSFSVADTSFAHSQLGFECRIALATALGAAEDFIRGKGSASGN